MLVDEHRRACVGLNLERIHLFLVRFSTSVLGRLTRCQLSVRPWLSRCLPEPRELHCAAVCSSSFERVRITVTRVRPITAPVSGPAMKIHRFWKWPDTTAGPSERAGLSDAVVNSPPIMAHAMSVVPTGWLRRCR